MIIVSGKRNDKREVEEERTEESVESSGDVETRGKKRRPEKGRGDERKGAKIATWHKGKSLESQFPQLLR